MSEPYWIDVGKKCFVLSTEVVAVHDGYDSKQMDREEKLMPCAPFAGVKAIIVLRNGVTFPSYITSLSLRRRLASGESWAKEEA